MSITKNKLALAIRLIGEKVLEIEFLHWDKRFLSDTSGENSADDKFVYFQSKDEIFCIYSHEFGYIIDTDYPVLVVPDQEYMVDGYKLSHEFENDDKRKDFVKKMTEYLPEWALDWDEFVNDELPKHDFVIHDQYLIY